MVMSKYRHNFILTQSKLFVKIYIMNASKVDNKEKIQMTIDKNVAY